jgi:hypothetical protein
MRTCMNISQLITTFNFHRKTNFGSVPAISFLPAES